MFHAYHGKIEYLGAKLYIINPGGGIEVDYKGRMKEGLFFVYPLLDERSKTVHYFAFESAEQKDLFSDFLKVQGVGPKTAFSLAHLDPDKLRHALRTLDTTIFQWMGGIGPKTAKKLLIQLKDTLTDEDLAKLNVDDVTLKLILKTMKVYGYGSDHVIKALETCPFPLQKDKLNEIIPWLVKAIKL